MKRIGCTGHQALSAATRLDVVKAMTAEIANHKEEELLGLTCFAEGADQIFAFAMLAAGAQLHAVIPSKNYETSFQSEQPRAAYECLLRLAASRSELAFPAPGEDAYMAAGQEVVDQSDILLAVWDGKPAGGKGGTADVVAYAQRRGTDVRIIWPTGATRE
ncbi:hypothetical protein HTV80_03225 [Streptomyces sp. Vc74B-19]|uniref:hypothetical protein n=1 Tax=unclassified Streptomyces TaxID=2593676 RepID=UPI001BFC0C4C|nr:hypothetical protein [Streptomyces sp. Vc74B-19]MBT3162124.1 hypothetical protein [Streptomyces sp. Vc74B-19]